MRKKLGSRKRNHEGTRRISIIPVAWQGLVMVGVRRDLCDSGKPSWAERGEGFSSACERKG